MFMSDWVKDEINFSVFTCNHVLETTLMKVKYIFKLYINVDNKKKATSITNQFI